MCMMMMPGMMMGPQQTPHQMPEPHEPVSALELLKLRYVKGEVSRAEFEEMRQVLAETKEG